MSYKVLMFCAFLQLGAMNESVSPCCGQNKAAVGHKLDPEEQLLHVIANKMESAMKILAHELPQTSADQIQNVVGQTVRAVLNAQSGFTRELVAIEGIVDHYRNRSFLSDSHFLQVLGDIVLLYFREPINDNIRLKKYIQKIVIDRLAEELKWQIIIPSKFGRYFLNQASSEEMKCGALKDAESKRDDTVIAACVSVVPQRINSLCFLTDGLLSDDEIDALKTQTMQGKKI